jgi:hypothetical protein
MRRMPRCVRVMFVSKSEFDEVASFGRTQAL